MSEQNNNKQDDENVTENTSSVENENITENDSTMSIADKEAKIDEVPISEINKITEAFHTKTKVQAPAQEPPKKRFVGVEDKAVETKRLIIFLALCFGVTWVVEVFAVIPMYRSGDAEAVKAADEMISQIMLTPALAAFVARLATREGLLKSGFQFNFAEHKFLFLGGWFGTTFLTALGAAIYFMIFPESFDPDMTNFIASYKNMVDAGNSVTEADLLQVVAAYKADLLLKLFTAPLLGVVNSFGEEWGFRAYLLPKLYRKIGAVSAMILSGLASGLWYAPLVVLGYYYGEGYAGFPITGILAMCLFGMVTGILYSFLSLRTGSIFPAVFAHSAVSIMMPQAALFCIDGGNNFVGPSPTGILSGIPFMIAAGICVFVMKKNCNSTANS